MPYDTKIEEAIDAAAGRWKHMGKKPMFGGICYLLKGNMCFGIYRDFLIVRAGKEKAAKALEEGKARPFDITGRPMNGWVMVDQKGWGEPDTLKDLA
jgi:TfoX/Sxy family transcriptional regulator of competence genes